jgi:hypothetical protein
MMKRYMVLTQKDKWFSGTFDANALEAELNGLASRGWRVVSMASASRAGVLTGGGKDELIILLEQDIQPPAASQPKPASQAAAPPALPVKKSLFSGPDDSGVYKL